MTPHRILISREKIAARVAAMGKEISDDLRERYGVDGKGGAGERVVLVPVLTGSIVFVADLIRHMSVQMSIRPITISSYPGTATTTQGTSIQGAVPTDLSGAHVIIADDILDSGKTLGLVRRLIAAQRPASVQIAVLLRKTEHTGRRQEPVPVEYVGFDIADEFVIGYGLDYDGLYRNLPDIEIMGA